MAPFFGVAPSDELVWSEIGQGLVGADGVLGSPVAGVGAVAAMPNFGSANSVAKGGVVYGLLLASANEVLLKAGMKEAKGLFATTGDDNQNLVISLTAKSINPGVRVVARCTDLANVEKIRRAGADAVVSPAFIGGMRLASEMVRPVVVSFLDIMLRDTDSTLRVEELEVPDVFTGEPKAALGLARHPETLLLAIRTPERWVFNPADDYAIEAESALVLMTTPKGYMTWERLYGEIDTQSRFQVPNGGCVNKCVNRTARVLSGEGW